MSNFYHMTRRWVKTLQSCSQQIFTYVCSSFDVFKAPMGRLHHCLIRFEFFMLFPSTERARMKLWFCLEWKTNWQRFNLSSLHRSRRTSEETKERVEENYINKQHAQQPGRRLYNEENIFVINENNRRHLRWRFEEDSGGMMIQEALNWWTALKKDEKIFQRHKQHRRNSIL